MLQMTIKNKGTFAAIFDKRIQNLRWSALLACGGNHEGDLSPEQHKSTSRSGYVELLA